MILRIGLLPIIAVLLLLFQTQARSTASTEPASQEATAKSILEKADETVSYTHLTLPTSDLV